MSGQRSCKLGSPRPSLARDDGEHGRLFLCARCRAQVLICRSCDRGQIYCNEGCAREARGERQREAGRRYQTSCRGRAAHASRARLYRARRKSVTHHGPLSQSGRDDPAPSTPPAAESQRSSPRNLSMRSSCSCQWCECRCSQFVRQEFLRRRRGLSNRWKLFVRRRPP